MFASHYLAICHANNHELRDIYSFVKCVAHIVLELNYSCYTNCVPLTFTISNNTRNGCANLVDFMEGHRKNGSFIAKHNDIKREERRPQKICIARHVRRNVEIELKWNDIR